jgi:hypothetical protein
VALEEKDKDLDQDVEVVELKPGEKAPAAEDGDDERVGAREAAPEGDDEAGDDDSPEREEIRERRRAERRLKRDRQKKAIGRDKVELNYLRTQNEALERRLMAVEQRTQGTEIATVDSRIGQVEQQIELADEVIAAAVTANNGADVVKAQKIRDNLRSNLDQLKNFKNTKQKEAQPQQQAPKVDAAIVARAQQFAEENKDWYDPYGRNEESAVVLAIDAGLARDGYNPTSDEYWDELRKRAAKRLPDRFKAADTQSDRETEDDDDDEEEEEVTPAPRRNGGPRLPTGGNGTGGVNGGTKFYISPERKQALVDAGVWDDPVLRKKYISKYAQWDADNAGRSRRQ